MGGSGPTSLTQVYRPAGRGQPALAWCGRGSLSGRSRPGGARCQPRRSGRSHLEKTARRSPELPMRCVDPRGTQTVSPGSAVHVRSSTVTSIGHVEHLPHLAPVVVSLEREPVAGLDRDDLDGDLLVGDELLECPPGALGHEDVVGRVTVAQHIVVRGVARQRLVAAVPPSGSSVAVDQRGSLLVMPSPSARECPVCRNRQCSGAVRARRPPALSRDPPRPRTWRSAGRTSAR